MMFVISCIIFLSGQTFSPKALSMLLFVLILSSYFVRVALATGENFLCFSSKNENKKNEI